MWKLTISTAAALILVCQTQAQISIQTEYIGRSAHKDDGNNKTGGRGDALVFNAAIQIPFAVRPTDDGRIRAWAASLNSSYTTFNNNPVMKTMSPEQIFNNRIGVMHLRPMGGKWSFMGAVGAGVYSAHTNPGRTRFDEVLFDGGALFIIHLRKNLDLGFGAAFNSSFGYPMAFPAVYLKWNTSGKYYVDIQMMNGASISGGVDLTRYLSLGLGFDVNGSIAMQKIEGRKMMFSHNYMTASFQPTFRIGKRVSIPLRAGVSLDRAAFYEERTLKAFFKAFGREYDPHFNPALYFSGGLTVSF